MKQALFLLILFAFVFNSYGQRKGKEFLYLKNGTIIKGRVVHQDSELVKLLSGDNLFVYKSNEIDSISQGKFEIDNRSFKADYFFDCSVGIVAGSSGNDKDAPFVFNASFNYRFINRCYAGAGLGVEFWNESYMPLTVNFQYLLRDTHFTPFVSLQGGYLIALGDAVMSNPYYYSYSSVWPNPNSSTLDANGGVVINPSFGIRSMVNQNFGWSFSFGYRYHQLNYSGEKDYSTEYNFNRLTLKVGIIFN